MIPAVLAALALGMSGVASADNAPAGTAVQGRVQHAQPDGKAGPLISNGLGPVISRSTIMARAATWVGNQTIHYSQSQTYPGPGGVYYRGDCSGFVSMALDLPSPGPNTVGLYDDVVQINDPSQLHPGDLLGVLGPNTGGNGGHVQIFKQWLNPQHSRVEVLEQGSDGANGADWPADDVYSWPEWPINNQPFLMYRYVNAVTPPSHPSDHVGDTSGDGYGDFLATRSDGTLWDYLNSQQTDVGGFPYGLGVKIGTGWGAYNRTVSADVDGNRYADMIATKPDGTLWYFQNQAASQGSTPYPSSREIGYGWNQFTQIQAADVDGDGYAELLAEKSDGTLWYWHNTPGAVFPYGTPVQIGMAWQPFTRVVAADVTGDGRADIVATDGKGNLWLWRNNLASRPGPYPYGSPVLLSGGWQNYNRIVATDVNGDGLSDLVGTDSNGNLWEWLNTGSASAPFSGPNQIGYGWQAYNRLFS